MAKELDEDGQELMNAIDKFCKKKFGSLLPFALSVNHYDHYDIYTNTPPMAACRLCYESATQMAQLIFVAEDLEKVAKEGGHVN